MLKRKSLKLLRNKKLMKSNIKNRLIMYLHSITAINFKFLNKIKNRKNNKKIKSKKKMNVKASN
jgi:hypothetical protein